MVPPLALPGGAGRAGSAALAMALYATTSTTPVQGLVSEVRAPYWDAGDRATLLCYMGVGGARVTVVKVCLAV